MSFNSISFLFYFLPLALIAYYLMPLRYKNMALILISLIFYSFGSIQYVVLICLSILFNYASCMEIADLKKKNKDFQSRAALWIAVAVDVGILAIFKYTSKAMPLGISFYTFSILSSLFDTYNGKGGSGQGLSRYALYVLLFTKITSGPIVRYEEFNQQLRKRAISIQRITSGLEQMLIGLFKKVLIADNLAVLFGSIHALPKMSAGTAFLGMAAYSLQLYFDFSGYSDMAIGLSRMLGIRFEKNFDYPYLSDGIAEFWRKWHISLGAWFREYVYIPMGGNRVDTKRQVINLLTVWLLTGIWHGSTFNFVVWGLYHFAFIVLERFVFKKEQRAKIPRPVRIIVTMLIAWVGWVFFFSPSLVDALAYLHQLLGGGGLGLFDSTFAYYLRSSLILLLVALMGCGPWVYRAWCKLRSRGGKTLSWVAGAAYVLLFIGCITQIVGATYSSFLYFSF